MRLCHSCYRLTLGSPRFCNSCGRSYDVKLCPSGHRNARTATACAECGSRELSTPQRQSALLRRGRFVAGLLGLALIGISLVFVGYYAIGLLEAPHQMLGRLITAAALGLAWLAYVGVVEVLGLRPLRP